MRARRVAAIVVALALAGVLVVVALPRLLPDPPTGGNGENGNGEGASLMDVSFAVHVPPNTPADDTVYLLLLAFFDWYERERIALTEQADGTWRGTATDLPENATLRYVYDRGWSDWAAWKDTREAFEPGLRVGYRQILVQNGTAVEDTVATWADLPSTGPTGIVTGVVRDATSGAPLMDATVSIAGIHVPTDHEGRFEVAGVAAGAQSVLVATTKGAHRAEMQTATVADSAATEVTFDLEPAAPVTLTFDVVAPTDTPADARIKIAGNVYQLGAAIWDSENQLLPSPSRYVVTAPTARGYTASVTLHEGTYVEYVYTLGRTGMSVEREVDGSPLIRHFVVGGTAATREDAVSRWRTEGQVALTLRAVVPANTPARQPVYMRVGPLVPMDPVDEVTWTFTYYGSPGETLDYRYVHGGGLEGGSLFGDDPEATRSVTLPGSDDTVENTVEFWARFPPAPAPGPDESVNLTFRVSVPPNTPPNETVSLEWSSAELGFGNANLTATPGNPAMWEGRIEFSKAGTVTYHYARGAGGTPETGSRTLEVRHENQLVHDGVYAWSDLPYVPRSTGFLAGVGPEDFWSPEFLPLYDPLLDTLEAFHAEWVVLTSVWSYGQVEPLPTVEPRPLRAPGVYTPLADLEATVDSIHARGLRAFLVPQFNMELTPNGSALWGTHNGTWWDAWFEGARRLYHYHAEAAERMDIEMLLLPGPGFHAFPIEGQFEDPGYVETFDQRMEGLLGEVRSRYSGSLVVSASNLLYDFPELADYVGTTTFDLGAVDLTNRTVADLRAEYEALLEDRVRPMFDRYGKPVVFYQVAIADEDASPGSALTPGPLLDQANAYEAFFQALANRSWIAGTFTFGHLYAGGPLDPGFTTREKPAESVLAKYYAVLPAVP